MNPTLPQAPSWSEQTESSICSWDHGWPQWSYGNHQGSTTLSNMREAARDGCIRCKLLLRGIEKYTFPPYRPRRTTEATLSEYEPDRGLMVSVRNDPDTPLIVAVEYERMTIETGSLPMVLYFYTQPDKPPYFSDIQPAGHIAADPASQACFDKVREWIRECNALHPQCSPETDTSTRPTRLISVGSSQDNIKLCSLIEIPADARYVALSHSWGIKEERMKDMPLLLTKNLSARLLGIPWHELTQTFQDAITITRNVGVPYVWIDSLCIVQDDSGDWAKEAASMASVYKYAYLVIAATSSKNGDGGCLRNREPSHDLAGPTEGSFHVQRHISHRALALSRRSYTEMPLLDRAWCFQERMLASRILHYTEFEMMWECHKEVWCECQTIKRSLQWRETNDTSKLAHAAAVASIDPGTRTASWNNLVYEYSQRALTFGTDRLPGISGVAREIALPGMGRYLAGLWECEFPGALLWSSVIGSIDRSDVLPRPAQYSAPTWSWASIVTAVASPEPIEPRWSEEPIPICRVIDITCTPKTVDLYGDVQDGQLRISGPTLAATLWRTDREDEHRRYDVRLETPDPVEPRKKPDFRFTSDIQLTGSAVNVVILFIQWRTYDAHDRAEGIVLVQSETHGGCWERIGIFRGENLELSHAKETELIIV